jgi:hypothetical protein
MLVNCGNVKDLACPRTTVRRRPTSCRPFSVPYRHWPFRCCSTPDTYLRTNVWSIPNYGERYRVGEAISSSIAESAVNQVIAKRMVKKQQMRWTPRGAHLLLQVRTRVLNDQLAGDFRRWYPGLSRAPDPAALAA